MLTVWTALARLIYKLHIIPYLLPMTINIYHPYQKWETSAVIFNIIVRTSAKDTLQRQFAHYLHSATIPLLGSQIIYSAVSNVNLLFKMVSSVKPVTTVKLIHVGYLVVLSSLCKSLGLM